ncbi:MAG: SEC-C metal-binding domain-containing protein [Bacillota bacterium]
MEFINHDDGNVYDVLYRDEESVRTILAEHPEVKILWGKRGEFSGPIVINGVNPLLHVLIEGVAENQIKEENPPEAREAFLRLQNMGLTRHAARGAITALLVPHLFRVLKKSIPFDAKAYSRRLKILGTDLRNVGRNEPCPCGSGQKFKKCCQPLGEYLAPRKNAGALVLGYGSYASLEYLRSLPPESLILQIENRVHIARFFEAHGDLSAALTCLKENVALTREDEKKLLNALQDLQLLCMNHPELSAEGIKATDRLIALAEAEDQKGMYRCDRADLLAAAGQRRQAEEEFHTLFRDLPGFKFGRYRYALFLEQYGRSAEAEAVLKELLAHPAGLDAETYGAAQGALANLQRAKRKEGC